MREAWTIQPCGQIEAQTGVDVNRITQPCQKDEKTQVTRPRLSLRRLTA
jgi:hypothetical protein